MLCVAPCKPDVVSGEAALDGAGVTVGVMVDVATWLSESFTTYLIGVAVPENVGRGSKVTSPVVGLTVYVPSPLIVNVVPLHEAVAVAVVHNLTVVGFRDAAADPESFVSGLMTWFVSYGPVFVSGATVGGGTTVGV
jgi:hypothetical protein